MKKAQGLSLEIIIIAAISLFVLIVLLVIFRVQIFGGAEKYTKIGESAEQDIKGEKCASFIAVRQCSKDKPSEDYEWTDLGKKNCGAEEKCWERGVLREIKK